MFKKTGCFFLLFIFVFVPVFSQPTPSPGFSNTVDPLDLIGLTLGELIGTYGIPLSVYAVRGLEVWQDDVVFVYDHGDYYVYRDRVWQVGIGSAKGISVGDPRGLVSLLLGPDYITRGNSILFFIDDKSWPLMVRFDFDSNDMVKVIFIYRTDF